MKKQVPKENNQQKALEEADARIHYLEQINRLSLDALDQAAQLGDFQESINQLDSPTVILEETQKRIRSLIPFEAVAFYLVNEETSEFYIAECQPKEVERFIKAEVENYIDNGTFAWAIREQRPIFVATMDLSKKIVLDVLTTASRVRGMFVGVLTYGEMDVPLASLSLMSIILRHSANALESFELYNMIKAINRDLEKIVEKRTGELEQSLQQLRHAQKMEALGRLAGGIAHDFTNIITSITMASEVSLKAAGLPTEIKRNIEEILVATESAGNLTRQLLAFSKKQVTKPKPMDINSVVADIKKMLSRLISDDIEIILESDENLPLIKADPGQIDQILINLAINAQDALHEQPEAVEKKIVITIIHVVLGEDDPEIKQKIVSRTGDYILISFTDTGVGMDEPTCQRIFEPFFTTKGEGKGTGLGLATVYGIVTQNNGGISLESIPGKGTTFYIYWPCSEG